MGLKKMDLQTSPEVDTVEMSKASGHAEALRVLVEAGGNALHNLREALRVLVEAGGNALLNLRHNDLRGILTDNSGRSTEALRVVADAGGAELLMLTDNDGMSCAYWAARSGRGEALRVLASHPHGGKRLLLLASTRGEKSPHAPWSRESCAHAAAAGGHTDALQVVVEAGGQELVMLTDSGGASCAHKASDGAHVAGTDSEGASCACKAADGVHVDALGVLIKAGGKELLMIQSKTGGSCAHSAAALGHTVAPEREREREG
ncbi:hypothetical protein T484DRAFT_1774144 [Baffinella frigidus]|nr:hypothetical protein T484DRAFT_1774144 [Cryptophyta sp. CCMP2293]